MMIVGLTGGIGSGKSTVAKFFRQLGVSIYDSDNEAKMLMNESKSIKEAIIALFGKNAYIDKKLNKPFIAAIVFNDKKKLDQLNNIVHPAVRSHFLKWITQQKSPYVIQESALIFENNAHKKYDAVILVTASEEIRIQRVIKRDGLTKLQVKARLNNQTSDDEKKKLADYVIENKNLKETETQVRLIHKKLMNRV